MQLRALKVIHPGDPLVVDYGGTYCKLCQKNAARCHWDSLMASRCELRRVSMSPYA